MSARRVSANRRRWLRALAAGVPALLALAGCGNKIAIPQPEGLFSVSAWLEDATFAETEVRQLRQSLGGLFVVTPTAVAKRDLEFHDVARAEGLTDATALCVDQGDDLVFVWDQGTRQLHWYSAADLTPLGSAPLPGVQSVRAVAADTAGIGQVLGARTYLYLADPDSAVVHRYAFDDFAGPQARGILTRSAGLGTRSVHEPAGLATDSEGRLLVCDTDTLRNWVIRFDGTPDLEDRTPASDDQDPLRGSAVVFEETACLPAPPADYTLGDAAGCGEEDTWVGAPSSAEGEFRAPADVAVDGSGRIFVADTGNSRVQVFDPLGHYTLQFGNGTNCPLPVALAIVDIRTGTGVADVNHAAYVFVLTPGTDLVRRFISSEHYMYIHREPPPIRP